MRILHELRDFVTRHLGPILVAVAVLAGGSYWYQVNEMHKTSECQAQYNQAFAQQLTIRSNLFQAADDTRSDLLGGVAKLILAPPSQNAKVREARSLEFRHLFEHYVAETKRVEEARNGTPLPPIPDCG